MRSGFCPAGIQFYPITAMLLIAGTAMSVMSARAKYQAAKKQKSALEAEGALKARQRDIQTRALAARQKVSFLSSGISLTGDGDVADVVMQDTYTKGLEDVNLIKQNYETAANNVMGQARAQMMADIGEMVMNVGMVGAMSGAFSGGGLTSAKGLTGSSTMAGQSGLSTSSGVFGMTTPAGYQGSRVGFMNGVPMSM
jgi:hypothetical protein